MEAMLVQGPPALGTLCRGDMLLAHRRNGLAFYGIGGRRGFFLIADELGVQICHALRYFHLGLIV